MNAIERNAVAAVESHVRDLPKEEQQQKSVSWVAPVVTLIIEVLRMCRERNPQNMRELSKKALNNPGIFQPAPRRLYEEVYLRATHIDPARPVRLTERLLAQAVLASDEDLIEAFLESRRRS